MRPSPFASLVLCFFAFVFSGETLADDWSTNATWHDGLVEKAVYAASRVVYGKPRAYTATFFTNKEQHDRQTLTKAEKSKDVVEVWKHNQLEDIPTPNYTYHYVTTAHMTVDGLQLTRLDCSSQEFCGTSFKQFLLKIWPGNMAGVMDYWSFSYMPEAGRRQGTVETAAVVPHDALPLYLRNYDFEKKPQVTVNVLPSQKSNRATAEKPVACVVSHVGEEDGLHKVRVEAKEQGADIGGTYWMAKDRLHVMVKFVGEGPDKQTYELKDLSRVNYWTIKGE